MTIRIAGREVLVGHQLYHQSLRAWGKVVRFDASGPAVLEIEQRPYGIRKFLVTHGGKIAGKREMFWHEPLFLDMPDSDVRFMQQLVDVLATKLGGTLAEPEIAED